MKGRDNSLVFLGYLLINLQMNYFSLGGWGFIYLGCPPPCLNIILQMLTAIMKGSIEHQKF